jgi:hypothetical protein
VQLSQKHVETLRVMQDVAKQHRIKRFTLNREVRAIERPVVDWRFGRFGEINADQTGIERCGEMVRDVAAAATYVEHA